MSAGRLQLYDKRAGLRDRTSRLLIRIDGRARAAPARVRHQAGGVGEGAARRTTVDADDAIATLGPEAWPDPPADLRARARRRRARCTRVLRDQRVIAGHRALVGRRDPVDREAVAVQARRRPRRGRGGDAARRRSSTSLDGALEHYEQVVKLPIPDKLPLPLQVHRKAGEPCPRCGDDDRGGPLRGLRHVLLPARSRRAARSSRTGGCRGC